MPEPVETDDVPESFIKLTFKAPGSADYAISGNNIHPGQLMIAARVLGILADEEFTKARIESMQSKRKGELVVARSIPTPKGN